MEPEKAISSEQKSSRRSFMQMTAAGAVSGIVAPQVMELMHPQKVIAQTKLSPEAALEELMAGNKRFAAGHLTAREHDLAELKRKTVNKQEPFASVLSCADSRVPVEFVFDQSIGDLFVTRVAGNIVTPEIIASLEYGVAVLGTKAILVMGHSSCGAVKATIEGKAVPGQISALYQHIQPAVEQAGPDLEATIRANASIQAALLRESSTVIAEKIKEGELKVAAAHYNIASGEVTLL